MDRITKYGETLGSGSLHTTGKFPSTNTNLNFCTRDNAEQFFLDHWGEHLELRTDLRYEYDALRKEVRIYQLFENSKLITDSVPVGYEPAKSEAEAAEVFEKFRRDNRNPDLLEIEFTHED